MANFDPDAYLSQNNNGFDPDAYLSSGVSRAVPEPQNTYNPNAPQPGIWDRVVGSPLGRFVGEAVVKPAASLVEMIDRQGGQQFIPNGSPVRAGYEGSLARNRNTPGYAAARQQADAVTNSGLTDQLTAPLMPSMAGATGVFGGFDAMNARADAQTAAQEKYASENPVKSLAAGLAGGFLASPKMPTPLRAPPITAAATVRPAAAEAINAGYKLTPRMISTNPSWASNTLAGWSGKVKTAQAASSANQDVTNALAAADLGLPKDAVLTEKTFATVRKNAGSSYQELPNALPTITVDKDFLDNVANIKAASSDISQDFPELAQAPEIDKLVTSLTNKNTFKTKSGVELVKQLRADASANFRASNDPEKLKLAFAQRQAANEIEDLIERNLSAFGDKSLIDQLRADRVLIAKAHDIEAATNLATGNVSARKIAALGARGKPLSGNLETISNSANAFPKAFQSESSFGDVEPLSVLDLGVAAASVTHNPSLAAAILGRPIVRSALLSNPIQQRMLSAATTPQVARLPLLQFPALPATGAIPYGLIGSAANPALTNR